MQLTNKKVCNINQSIRAYRPFRKRKTASGTPWPIELVLVAKVSLTLFDCEMDDNPGLID